MKKERLSDSELTAWRMFIKSYSKIIEQIEHDLSENKRVPLGTYDVLIALFEAPDKKLRLQQLLDKVVLTKSGITRLADRLEREGLIRREVSETDRRGFYAVLTEEGEQQLRRAWPIYARGIKQYFAAPLSEDDIAVIGRALQNIHRNMEAVRAQGTDEHA
ncbi:MarR family winged helix-turn-helix transcriptional regulator [Paenibacillus sp. HJGM_3]|uniref:MarR family winged helix-turn-helix transcriptional regulator n=1 Tax=Paenibacillus sp. HJGM_3 TaxID=3379816 RepID=UPI00385922FE